MSTSSVYPLSTEQAFRLARESGFDGLEIMVTSEESTQSTDQLLALSRRYELPILSIHAPVLLLSQFVWGRSPQLKLERSARLAREVGAATVVAHPPFRWQGGYARDFLAIVRDLANSSGVEIAVENMFAWNLHGRALEAFTPGWDPTLMDCDAMTLDFSHAALSGRDSLDLALAMGSRLRHVHLCDGSGSTADGRMLDEHLVPGRGAEPVDEVLRYLAARDWCGSIIAEINTRSARTESDRRAMLVETVEFARSRVLADAARH